MTTCAIVSPPSILQRVNAHGHGFCQRANALLKFDFIIYADDTTLSSTINTFNNKLKNFDTQTLINDELSKIIEWLNINKLSLNKDKSKYMIFHMHKKEIPSFSLKLGNTNIKKAAGVVKLRYNALKLFFDNVVI